MHMHMHEVLEARTFLEARIVELSTFQGKQSQQMMLLTFFDSCTTGKDHLCGLEFVGSNGDFCGMRRLFHLPCKPFSVNVRHS